MNHDELHKKAEARVDARIGFYIHAAVYALVNALLWVINAIASPEYLWARWPTMGWGIGLVSHGVAVALSQRGRKCGGLRERMIKVEMEDMERQNRSVAS